MKASELRIGNYVKTQIHGVGTVEAISENKILHSMNWVSLDMEYFEPIPLTEKWLLDFGFKMERVFEARRFTLHNGFIVNIQNRGVINFGIFNNAMSVEIKHVHQLQNLYFALTKKELTIK